MPTAVLCRRFQNVLYVHPSDIEKTRQIDRAASTLRPPRATKMMQLTEIERALLAEVVEQRGCVRAVRLYGPEKAAANRLVRKEALYLVSYANGPHYEITDAGRAAIATRPNT